MSTTKQHFTGNGTGKAPAERSSFAMTCNRLSLFLKERGNLRDLGINGNFDVTGKPERSAMVTTTFDLLSNMEGPVQSATETEKSMNVLPQYVKLDSFRKLEDCTNKAGSSKPVAATESRTAQMNPLPQYVSLDSFFKLDDCSNKASSIKPVAATESKTAQMTIFYGGQVLVFDDFPADRARDLMQVAKSASNSNGKIENRVELASTSKSHCEVFGSQEQIHAHLQANGSDLPIARRASLHKFLAKRKDRATLRAPYQLHNPSTTAAPSNHKFDLNLLSSLD